MKTPRKKHVVILGAGPAGLAAGYYLSRKGVEVTVIEKKQIVGGLAATLTIKDNTVDYGPHSFHLKPTNITQLFEELVGADSVRVSRKAKMWLKKRELSFPLSMKEALFRLPVTISARIAFDFVFSRIFLRNIDENESFESYGIKHFGKTLYRLAFGNYSEKAWGLSGSELSSKLARQKLLTLNIKTLILALFGLLSKKEAELLGLDKKTEYDAYPRKGIGVFFEKLSDEIRQCGGKICVGADIRRITMKNGKKSVVEFSNLAGAARIHCDAIVSTIPIPSLVGYLDSDVKHDRLMEEALKLSYRDLICIYLVLDKDYFSDAHWIYLLDDDMRGNRLSEQKNLNPESCRPGTTVLSIDMGCNKDDFLWNASDAFLIGLAINDLQKLGVNPRTILDGFVLRTDNAYPVYKKGFEKSVEMILDDFAGIPNLFSTGRNGLYLNNDIHDSMEMGYLVAEHLLTGDGISDSAGWYQQMRVYVYNRLEGRKKDAMHFERKP